MSPEQYLITAIASEATCIIFLFAQLLAYSRACAIEKKECQDKYEKLLERVAKLER